MKSRFIICGMALAAASIAQAAYTPIAIQSSSYNADVIVESNATPTLKISTTASIDEGTNNYNATWFEQGFDTANPETACLRRAAPSRRLTMRITRSKWLRAIRRRMAY